MKKISKIGIAAIVNGKETYKITLYNGNGKAIKENGSKTHFETNSFGALKQYIVDHYLGTGIPVEFSANKENDNSASQRNALVNIIQKQAPKHAAKNTQYQNDPVYENASNITGGYSVHIKCDGRPPF